MAAYDRFYCISSYIKVMEDKAFTFFNSVKGDNSGKIKGRARTHCFDLNISLIDIIKISQILNRFENYIEHPWFCHKFIQGDNSIRNKGSNMKLCQLIKNCSKTCIKWPLKKKTKNWFSKPIIA